MSIDNGTNAAAQVPDGLQVVMQQRDHYAARVENIELGLLRIADDFHPNSDAEAPLALGEMREAIRALALAAPQPAAQQVPESDFQQALDELAACESMGSAILEGEWPTLPPKIDGTVSAVVAEAFQKLVNEHGELRANQAAQQVPEDVRRLREALMRIIEMNRQHAEDQYGDANKAEAWSCVTVARAALAAQSNEKDGGHE